MGSTFTNAQASAGGTAIFAGGNLDYYFTTNSTTQNSSNLVIAKTGDVAAITAGHYWDTTYVSQLQALMNPNGTCVANHDCGWLRFMDFSSVEFNWEKDFSQRVPPTAISFDINVWYPAGYWVGQITNTSDALTVADPTVSTWSGSAYLDGAIVQGYLSATNTTTAPTLAVGGHPAKTILDDLNSLAPILLFINNAPSSPGTSAFTFTFTAGSASWLNSGSSCVGTYTTQAGDTTTGALAANLQTWLGGGTVGSNPTFNCLSNSGVFFGNNGNPEIFPITAQAGKLAVSYTSASDPSIFSPGTVSVGYIPSGATNRVTFRYSYLLDAWMYVPGEFAFSAPMEVAADLANQVGANVWWNFNFNSSSYVQSVVVNFATNLTSGLKFGFEPGNENWDCFGPKPCQEYKVMGISLGITPGGNEAMYSFAGLQAVQFATVASAAWTGAGRSAADFYVFHMTQAANEGANGNWDTSQLQGAHIGTANTYVANYGALGGGTVSTNFAAVGHRPVDFANVGVGLAPYWGSPWWGSCAGSCPGGAPGITGTVANNAPWLQAQLDYANGLTAQSFTEISNTFNGTTARTDGLNSGQLILSPGSLSTMFTSMEAICSEYDPYRPGAGFAVMKRFDYEAAPQWGFGTNEDNGTNSTSDSTSLTALAARFTALGWNVSAYTIGSVNTPSVLAQQTLNFSQAWKNSSSYGNMIYSTYYQNLQSISGSHREVHPSQYGYAANTWGLYPGDYHFNNPYGNAAAIATWNAGN